jgi:hypothetical protein
MDSDSTWFRIDTPDLPIYIEPIYHFFMFVLYAVVITTLALIVLHSALFIIFDHPLKWTFVFFGFSLTNVAWLLFNSASIYTITLTGTRGLMSTWLFIFVTCTYAAMMKWQFGTLFLGLETLNYWSVLIIGAYVAGVAELAALFRGTISTALTYKI